MKIAVVLFTYSPSVEHPRAYYARETLRSVLKKLEPTDFTVHIADDGSPVEHIQSLVEICERYGFPPPTITTADRAGYGRSYNLAMQALHESVDILLPLEDDWELVRAFEIQEMAEALMATDAPFGCIRLGYIGFTQPLRGEYISHDDHLWLKLDGESPEPHVWAGHPRLETVTWQRSVGPWPEGLNPGETEFEVAHWPAAREGVVWPVDFLYAYGDAFAHIGSVRAE